MEKLLLLLIPALLCSGNISAQKKKELPASILRNFFILDLGFTKHRKNIDKHNTQLMNDLEFTLSNFPEKAKPFYEKARVAVIATDSFVQFVDGIKWALLSGTGGRQEDGQLNAAGDVEQPAKVLFKDGRAEELQRRINALRVMLATQLDPADKPDFKTELFTERDASTNEAWADYMFKDVPMAAVFATLSKLQNDAKNSLSEVLTTIVRITTHQDDTFSNTRAIVVPRSTSVMLGTPFEADILLVNVASQSDHTVFVEGQKIETEAGIGKYITRPVSEGEYKIKGKIQEQNAFGEFKEYPFEVSYMAHNPPSVTILANKMNVLYSGLSNPLSVYVPGVPPEEIAISSTAGTMRAAPGENQKGQYEIAVSDKHTETQVRVSAKINGRMMPLGGMSYRVLPLPMPEIGVEGITTSTPTLQKLRAAEQVYALPSAGNPYEGIAYSVVSYDFMLIPLNGSATTVKVENTASLDQSVKKLLEKAATGDKVLISNVAAKGPAGKVFIPSSLLYTIK
jgi:gliding motility-associated protein GldM